MSESRTEAARGREGGTMNGAAGGALGSKPGLRALILSCVLAALVLGGCVQRQPTPRFSSVEQMIEALQNTGGAEFWYAAEELAKMEEAAAPAAPALARALRAPRHDSYMAGIALVAIGPAAEPAIPEIMRDLVSDREIVRAYAALALGAIGAPARCAVPELATHLWDLDPEIRSATAVALQQITGVSLVRDTVLPGSGLGGYGVSLDTPEGEITGRARTWWTEEGKILDWSSGSDACRAAAP
jgi:hypothetical protein